MTLKNNIRGMFTLNLKAAARNENCAAGIIYYISRTGAFYCTKGKQRDNVIFLASGNMPTWAICFGSDNEEGQAGVCIEFWKALDNFERANGQLYKSLVIGLPAALTHAQNIQLATEYAEQVTKVPNFGGMPWAMALHAGGGTNPHIHLVVCTHINDGIPRPPEKWFSRPANVGRDPATGGTRKCADWSRPTLVGILREAWEFFCNRALERAGSNVRVDRRTYEDQGIDLVSTVHRQRGNNELQCRLYNQLINYINEAGPEIRRWIIAASEAAAASENPVNDEFWSEMYLEEFECEIDPWEARHEIYRLVSKLNSSGVGGAKSQTGTLKMNQSFAAFGQREDEESAPALYQHKKKMRRLRRLSKLSPSKIGPRIADFMRLCAHLERVRESDIYFLRQATLALDAQLEKTQLKMLLDAESEESEDSMRVNRRIQQDELDLHNVIDDDDWRNKDKDIGEDIYPNDSVISHDIFEDREIELHSIAVDDEWRNENYEIGEGSVQNESVLSQDSLDGQGLDAVSGDNSDSEGDEHLRPRPPCV